MNFFGRLALAISYGTELEQLVKQIREDNAAKKREEDRHRLKLCFKHRQEANHSHYAEHNCDYCRLLKCLDEKGTRHDR